VHSRVLSASPKLKMKCLSAQVMRVRHDPQASRLSQTYRKAVSHQWQLMAGNVSSLPGHEADFRSIEARKAEVSYLALSRTGSLGQLRSSESQENRNSSDRFKSIAAIRRRLVERAKSPKRFFMIWLP
jgi:hypothetical protein